MNESLSRVSLQNESEYKWKSRKQQSLWKSGEIYLANPQVGFDYSFYSISCRLFRGAKPSGVTDRCYPGGPLESENFSFCWMGPPCSPQHSSLRQHAYEFIPISTVHAEWIEIVSPTECLECLFGLISVRFAFWCSSFEDQRCCCTDVSFDALSLVFTLNDEEPEKGEFF